MSPLNVSNFADKASFQTAASLITGVRVRVPQQKLDAMGFWSLNLASVGFQSCYLDIVALFPPRKSLWTSMP